MKNPNLPQRGTPTSTNVFALDRFFASAEVVPNQMHAVDYPHIVRCLKAGLIVECGATAVKADRRLALTDLGRLVLKTYRLNGNRYTDAMAAMISDSMPHEPAFKVLVGAADVGPRMSELPAESREEARAVWLAWIAKHNLGASQLSRLAGKVKQNGRYTFRFSYNGRAWHLNDAKKEILIGAEAQPLAVGMLVRVRNVNTQADVDARFRIVSIHQQRVQVETVGAARHSATSFLVGELVPAADAGEAVAA